MIRCRKCGTLNDQGVLFCTKCASFLEWTGEKVTAEQPRFGDDAADGSQHAATEATIDAAAQRPAADEGPPGAERQETDTDQAGAARIAEQQRAEAEAEAARIAEQQRAAAQAAAEATRQAEAQRAATAARAAASSIFAPLDRPTAPPAGASTAADSPPSAGFRFRAAATPAARPGSRQPEVSDPARPDPATRAASSGPGTLPSQPPARTPAVAQQPPSRQPDAVQPAVPRRRIPPPRPAQPIEEVRPGDLLCINCGAGNEPVRRFCRRCGQSLVAAVVAKRPPWYRRAFRRQRALSAGARPDAMGRARQVHRSIIRTTFRLTILAALLTPILGFALVPTIREQVTAAVNDLRLTFLPRLEPVLAVGSEGAGAKDHPGALAADDDTNTYWLADPAAGAMAITIRFDQPTDLGGLVFHLGSATDTNFSFHRRPHHVRLTAVGSPAPPVDLELKDQSEPESYPIDMRKVTRLELRILDFYPSGQSGRDTIALREVEFKARR